MSRRRKFIRQRIKTLLSGAIAEVGTNVFTNRAGPTDHSQLPAIIIYPRSESIEDLGTAPKEYKRLLDITVEILAAGPQDPFDADAKDKTEDVLDDIGEQVEDLLSRDDSLGDYTPVVGAACRLVDRLDMLGVEYQFEGEGREAIGSLRLTFQAIYAEHRPLHSSLQGNIDDLDRVVADWSVGHHDSPPDSTNEAQDDLDFSTP